MEQQPSLFKNSRFILLFLGSFLAIIGFSMFFMTTTWFIISDLGSASSLGIILIAITVPRILMMAFGGVLADKLDDNHVQHQFHPRSPTNYHICIKQCKSINI